MIVRIATEGQFRVSEEVLDKINEMDNRLVDITDRDNEQEFHRLFKQMLDIVRVQGNPLEPDEILPSDVVLPPPDISLAEAKEYFQGEGVIPG